MSGSPAARHVEALATKSEKDIVIFRLVTALQGQTKRPKTVDQLMHVQVLIKVKA